MGEMGASVSIDKSEPIEGESAGVIQEKFVGEAGRDQNYK